MLKKYGVGSLRTASRVVCLALAAVTLAGCIVVPAYGPRYHPRYYYDR